MREEMGKVEGGMGDKIDSEEWGEPVKIEYIDLCEWITRKDKE